MDNVFLELNYFWIMVSIYFKNNVFLVYDKFGIWILFVFINKLELREIDFEGILIG